jgi:hypothetical protein
MITSVISLLEIIVRLLFDLAGPIALSATRRWSIEAGNLFLRRELTLFKDRGVMPKLVDTSARLSLALLSRQAGWRDTRVVAHPETMIRWHSAGWRLF